VLTGEGNWTVWYYQGCVHAMAMDEPPEPPEYEYLEDALEAVDGPAGEKIKSWMRANDSHASQAVEALNRAVGRRSMRGKTAIQAGVSDWLFFRDPDLDRLRPHLRFSRWSDGLFETDHSALDLERADRELHYWSKGRYKQPDRLARLAGETFTTDLLSGPTRANAIHFATEASRCGQDTGLALTECWELLERDHEAWCQLVGVPRFIGSPQMRARAWHTARDVARNHLDYPIYPNTLSAYRRVRLVPIQSVTEHINAACQQSAADLEMVAAARHRGRETARRHAEAHSDVSLDNLEQLLLRASRRWWELLDALQAGEVGTAPKRPTSTPTQQQLAFTE
jgi:hypothetical protein